MILKILEMFKWRQGSGYARKTCESSISKGTGFYERNSKIWCVVISEGL